MTLQYLQTLAQIAVGLLGFTGVIVAFASRPGEWSGRDRARLLIVLAAGIASLFLCLLPLALASLGVPEPLLWRIASAAVAACTLGIAVAFFRRFEHLDSVSRRTFAPAIIVPLSVGSALNLLAQCANALGMFAAAEGVFLAGMIWTLFPPALQFGRMVYLQMVASTAGN